MSFVKHSTPLLFIAAAACQQVDLQTAPDVEQTARGVLTEVSSFGPNPGALDMFKYVPANLPNNAPLVVAMHACAQDAEDYENAGWNALADQHGFAVLYPEQTYINNSLRCFNWAGEGYVVRDTANLERGQGENQSIISMIDQMVADHGIDTNRVYMMGHSGGGAQVALMTAVWPDRVAGAGIIAGIPYRCTTELTGVNGCLLPGVDRTPSQWGDLARMGNPGYTGAWPKMSIWHGTADNIVALRNQSELLEQFSNLYGIDAVSDASTMLGTAQVESYNDASGQPRIETVTLENFGHATPIDPGSGCGSAGSYFADAGICAVEQMANFWGLIGGAPQDTMPPVVDITAPASGATVMGTVSISVSAQDDTAVTRVQVFAGASLVGESTAPPFEFGWDTAGLAAGSYDLRAVAFDAAGNRGVDEDTQVTLQSTVMDTDAPQVSITSPADGAVIVAATTVTVEATDDFGVAEVEVLLDGASLGVLNAPPYEVSLDPSTVAEGVHTLAAQARDAAGNQGEAMISVTTEGGAGPDTTAPTVQFTSPADGDTVRELIRVTAEAMDDVAVTAVVFTVDGEQAGIDVVRPYDFLFDTSLVETGTHAFGLAAFDAAGNPGVAGIVVTVEAPAEPEPNPEPNPAPTNSPDVDNDRWGCSTTGASSQTLVTLFVVAGAVLTVRRRRR